MWPDQQPPGGAQNPQHDQQNPYQQPGYQQPNPYQQPGYPQHPQAGPYGQQQPGPYGQQAQPGPYGQQQWGQPPTAPVPEPPRGGGGRTKLIAVVAAAAVVVTAAVTGYLVLGGGKDDEADDGKGGRSVSPSPAGSSPASPTSTATDNPRSGASEKPTVPGWKVVINPKYGTAFDVPADWEVERPGVFSFFQDEQKGDGSAYIGFSGPAFLEPDHCVSDDSGYKASHALAGSGTKGENGAKDTASIARGDAATFAFGGYTDQSKAAKKYLRIGKAAPFTTASGVKGSVARSYVVGVPKKHKCDTDGKAVTFAFKNSTGSFVSWTLYGAKGVKDELSDATIDKILTTVRLHGDPLVD
ncbi:hypothetical protein GCM10018980_00710 [Streptomyces capoamus]|uniref:DUF8017 domain-containing protein n=1 Tax=Streptomyces capoamus TaxID=68183 RepID=A0A919C0H6_9ACTN|nr:hypothetical protein [Streptomyces capoamus]GGW11479.1 hypothetical protein GCM10010501_08760 [Streptomyces libani subsp. rufus]GHG32604.1 hypothetical protein GCM10018980_00710 [Streptomyces capoamus]